MTYWFLVIFLSLAIFLNPFMAGLEAERKKFGSMWFYIIMSFINFFLIFQIIKWG
jgi:hypothetical protein